MYANTLTDHLILFIKSRPAISPDRLAHQLGFNRSNLHKILLGLRSIPQHRRGDFHRIMKYYGYTDHIDPIITKKK